MQHQSMVCGLKYVDMNSAVCLCVYMQVFLYAQFVGLRHQWESIAYILAHKHI